jgi:hypothetical protein
LSAPDGPPVVAEDSFQVTGNCDQAGRFTLSMDAGFVNAQAGASSAFSLTLSRESGQQKLLGVTVTLPPGFIADVPVCPEAQAASGSCSAASQVGETTIAVGDGTSPLYIPEASKSPTAVYLAGP